VIWIGTLISIALYVLSFAPWDYGYLSFIALVPLFVVWTPEQKRSHILWSAFLINFGLGLGGFSWIAYASVQFGQLPWVLGFLVLLLFCATGQLVWIAYAWLRFHLRPKHPLLWVACSGLLFSGIEFLIPKLFLDSFGNSWHSLPYFRQLSSVGGVPIITALLISWNEALSYAVIRFKEERIQALLPASVGTALLLSVFAWGSYRLQELQPEVHDDSFRVSVIQANVGDVMKMAAESGLGNASSEIIDRYLALSQEAQWNHRPDLIVWPETAYPSVFGQPFRKSERDLEQKIYSWKSTFDGAFAFGGYDRDRERKEYNSLFFWQQGQPQVSDTYHKSVLLMFAETLPFADFFPSLKGLIPNMGFFGRGKGAQVVNVRTNALGDFFLAPQICYEGLLPDFSVAAARLGADAILNVTNDSWFGNTGEPELHLALTVFRSIETGIPMVRATNTGITTLIDATGEITGATQVGQQSIASYRLPRQKGRKATVFVRYPNAMRYLSLSVLLVGVVFLLRGRHRAAAS
jgi:apolipoprotein N-acyltransferase